MRRIAFGWRVGFCLMLMSVLLAASEAKACTPGEVCSLAPGPCANDAICTAAGVCPANPFKSSSTPCRAAVDVCDAVEYCTGTSAACPADAYRPSSYVCRAGSDCGNAAYCTGTSVVCPTSTFKSSGTLCRAASDCSNAAYCTGASALCPANPKPQGAACAGGVCDGAGLCGPICTLEGVVYASGAANPENECQFCNPASHTTAWTHRAQGFACADDGLPCTNNACDGAGLCRATVHSGCLLENGCVPSGAKSPQNGCLECNPSHSTTAYVPSADGTPCGDASWCDGAGTCVEDKPGAEAKSNGGGCSAAGGGGALLLSVLLGWALLRRRP